MSRLIPGFGQGLIVEKNCGEHIFLFFEKKKGKKKIVAICNAKIGRERIGRQCESRTRDSSSRTHSLEDVETVPREAAAAGSGSSPENCICNLPLLCKGVGVHT